MRLLTIAALLVSTSAFACPNLAGRYPMCRAESGRTDRTELVIAQSVSNRVTTFNVTSILDFNGEIETSTYIANGKTVVETGTFPDSDMPVSLETTASCSGNTLNITEKILMDGELFAMTIQKVTKTGKTLTVKMHTIAMDEEVRETIICE